MSHPGDFDNCQNASLYIFDFARLFFGHHSGTEVVKSNIDRGTCLCTYCIARTEKDGNDLGLFSQRSMRVSGLSSLNCLECCRSTVASFILQECELSTVNMAFNYKCT